MTTYSSRLLASFEDVHQRPIDGKLDGESHYDASFNQGNGEPVPSNRHHGLAHFKSAQWYYAP